MTEYAETREEWTALLVSQMNLYWFANGGAPAEWHVNPSTYDVLHRVFDLAPEVVKGTATMFGWPVVIDSDVCRFQLQPKQQGTATEHANDDDLATWLRTQLDADERVARGSTPGPWVVSKTGHNVFAPGQDLVVTEGFDGGPWSKVDPVHIARHDPARVLAEVAAKRAIIDRCTPKLPVMTEQQMHEQQWHPDYEYETTRGQRKAWDYSDRPPKGDGWERNVDRGDQGWERFDYHEEAYWRRLRPGGREPVSYSLTLRLLALPYADQPGYREEWRP